jgi:hypothetical protein
MIRIFLILTIFSIKVFSNKSSDNEYELDFSIEKETLSGTQVSFDVLKSTKNDVIIESNDRAQYNRLEWVSIGDPQLFKKDNQPFRFAAIGFEMKIQILNHLDKQLIKNEIFRKYNIETDMKNIKTKKINQMECNIQFEIESETLNLRGTVQHFNKNPFEVWFNYKDNSKEYKLFQKSLETNKDDIIVSCSIGNNKTGYSNNIKIEISMQFNKKLLGMEDKYLKFEKEINETNKNLKSELNFLKNHSNQLEDRFNKYINQMEINIIRELNKLNNKFNSSLEQIASIEKKFKEFENKLRSKLIQSILINYLNY